MFLDFPSNRVRLQPVALSKATLSGGLNRPTTSWIGLNDDREDIDDGGENNFLSWKFVQIFILIILLLGTLKTRDFEIQMKPNFFEQKGTIHNNNGFIS